MKMHFSLVLIALGVGVACGGFAWAQTGTAGATSTAGTTTFPAPSTKGAESGRLVTSFAGLAGSTENAASLVNGLRTGSSITLASGTGGAGSSTTFTPPTRPMGYGNVRIALSLAQADLASQGITEPTPQQLQTALMGSGSSSAGTASTGILQMRASGMGWGQIANSMGFKLGAVMSGHVPAAATATTVTTATGASASATVNTAAGGHGRSSGIVTAGGGAGSASTGLGRGHMGGGASAGVVSAQGAAHGQSAGNQGKGKP